MRLDRIWIVAKKDMAEFRTNKYIMYTLVLMPLLMALVLPTIYLTPVTMFSAPSEPYDLGIVSNQTLENETIQGGTYQNITFVDCVLEDVIAESCYFEGCELRTSLVRSSQLANSTVFDGAVMRSNVLNVTFNNAVASDLRNMGEDTEQESFLFQFIGFLLLFFILIPAIIPTVIASYSFVGEKLNRSLEPLLATPTTDAELLAGKSLSIFLPTMLVTWLSFIPFVLLVNFLAAPILGYAPLPDLTWLIGVFLLAPLFCIMAIALNVIVSSRVTDVRASQQLGSLVVLPVVAVFIISLSGLFVLGPLTMLLMAGVIALVDIGIAYLTVRTFQREEILIRWK
jgi:ABC-2 type transport system permease protein